MSAGPTPPNPGPSVGNPKTHGAGIFARRGSLITAGVFVGMAGYLYFTKRPERPEGTPASVPSTPGIRNIEGAYTNAGATKTHTKAYGGTPMGDKSDESLREKGPAGTGQPKGFKSDAFGHDQRADDSTKIEKKFQESNYGDQKGK